MKKFLKSKALSIPLALMILLIFLVTAFVPALFILNSENVYSSQGSFQISVFKDEQQAQVNQVLKGEPNMIFTYDTYSDEYVLNFSYPANTVPIPINVSGVYYYNKSSLEWCLAASNFIVDGNLSIVIPDYNNDLCTGDPLIVVTPLGNVFYVQYVSS